MAMENGPFIGVFSIRASIPRGFSIAMFDYQRSWTLSSDFGYIVNVSKQHVSLKVSLLCKPKSKQGKKCAPKIMALLAR